MSRMMQTYAKEEAFQLQRLVETKSAIEEALVCDEKIMAWTAWGLELFRPDLRDEEIAEMAKNMTGEVESVPVRLYVDGRSVLPEEQLLETYLGLAGSPEEDFREWVKSLILCIRFQMLVLENPENAGAPGGLVSVYLFPENPAFQNFVLQFTEDEYDDPDFGPLTDPDMGGFDTCYMFLGKADQANTGPSALMQDEKQRTLLDLFDTIFDFGMETEEKLERLKTFGLTGDRVKRLLELVEALKKDYQWLCGEVKG